MIQQFQSWVYISKENENTNSKRYMHPKKIHTALFTTSKTWKKPKCPSTDEWIKKMWCIYIQHSAIKKNEILPFATTWMGIMLSEISETEKDKYCILPFICGI